MSDDTLSFDGLVGILDTLKEGVVVADATADGTPVVAANEAFLRMVDAGLDEVSGTSLLDVHGLGAGSTVLDALRKAVAGGKSFDRVIEVRRKDGSVVCHRFRMRPVRLDDDLRWFVGTAREITRDQTAPSTAAGDSGRRRDETVPLDRLTGLVGASVFEEELQRVWSTCRSEGRPLTVFLIDIDCFESYNATFGRKAGDSCLRLVAHALASGFRRSGELCARVEGQRFAGVAPGVPVDRAAGHAQSMIDRVRELCIHHPRSPVGRYVTVSVGVASLVPDEERFPEALMAAAAERLGAAKDGGRNQYASE